MMTDPDDERAEDEGTMQLQPASERVPSSVDANGETERTSPDSLSTTQDAVPLSDEQSETESLETQEAPLPESNTRTTGTEGAGDGETGKPKESDAATLLSALEASETRLLESFDTKLAYDQFKEQQIERLHEELQEYKRGLSNTLLMPLVKQIIRYIDQIPRHVQALRKKPEDQLGPDRLFKELEGVRDDLEIILENVGVTVFQNPEGRFDPKCQQARLTQPTENSENHGFIIARLLPGYEMNGKLVEKERVKVCVYREAQMANNADEQREAPS